MDEPLGPPHTHPWEWDHWVRGVVAGSPTYQHFCVGGSVSISGDTTSCSSTEAVPTYLPLLPPQARGFRKGDNRFGVECYVPKKTKGNPTFTGGWAHVMTARPCRPRTPMRPSCVAAEGQPCPVPPALCVPRGRTGPGRVLQRRPSSAESCPPGAPSRTCKGPRERPQVEDRWAQGGWPW